MTNFYGILLGARDKSVTTKPAALRQASLKVMKDRRYQHPYYWAGFVVVGSDR
jgi:CHAT domain-containing protein